MHRAREPSIGRIVATGHLPASTGLPTRPLRILGAYAVVYLLTGTGRYADALGYTVTVNAGDMIIVLPDVPHTYGPPAGQTWNQMFVVFEGPVFDVWRAGGLLDRPVHRLARVERWTNAFDEIVRHRPAGLAGACRLQLLLAEAMTVPGDEAGPDDERRWLTKAMALLDADIRRETPLEDIAAAMRMSYDGFRKRFRRLAGIPPARYRGQQAIDRACQMMVEGALTDREIAAALGFCDEFHFSHRFRQLAGRSPRQFRAAVPRRGGERDPA